MIHLSGIAGGRMIVTVDPLLTGQAGSPPDLVLKWNDMKRAPVALDLVLHLHGYSSAAARMNLATEKLPISGLDFGDPGQPPGTTPSRFRPTLCILSRGRYFGGRSGFGYDFPVLKAAPGTRRLIRDARDRFARATGFRHRSGRRILTAHSGGGAAVAAVARQLAPHEIHIFDGLYDRHPYLEAWAARAVARDAAALRSGRHASPSAYMEHSGHALRVLYIPGTGTEPASLQLAEIVTRALEQAGPDGPKLAPWYRVEPVAVAHLVMPRVYGWLLLTDAGAALVPPGAGASK